MNLHTSTSVPASECSPSQQSGPSSKRSASQRSTHTAAASSKSAGRKCRTTGTSKLRTGPQLEMFASLPQAIPVSRFPLLGSAEAKMIHATSGRQCAARLRKPGPLGLLVRMLLGTPHWGSTKCCLIWKTSVTPRNRLLFRLVPWGPISSESGYGFSPRPAAFDSGGGTIQWAQIRPGRARTLIGWLVLRYGRGRMTHYINPASLEQVLGVPPNHSAIRPSATSSSRKRRTRSCRRSAK